MSSDSKYILQDRIWFTRKAWIAAEKRLLDNEYHTQLLLVVYAAYTTCISVILLSYELQATDKKMVDTGMVVLAVILFGLSLYLNSKSFKDRAARFKNGYLSLHDIENAMNIVKAEADQDSRLQKFSESYTKVLRDVENHSEIDDIASRVNAGAGLRSRYLSTAEKIRYRWWRLWRFLALFIMYIAPIVVFLIFVFK